MRWQGSCPARMPVTGDFRLGVLANARHGDRPWAASVFGLAARGYVPDRPPRVLTPPARCGASVRYSPCRRISSSCSTMLQCRTCAQGVYREETLYSAKARNPSASGLDAFECPNCPKRGQEKIGTCSARRTPVPWVSDEDPGGSNVPKGARRILGHLGEGFVCVQREEYPNPATIMWS